MEITEDETLGNVRSHKSVPPTISKASPHRLPAFQALNRKKQIAEATRVAAEQRLLAELQRPKFLFEDLLISHTKPPSYHIHLAKEKRESAKKSEFEQSTLNSNPNQLPSDREYSRSKSQMTRRKSPKPRSAEVDKQREIVLRTSKEFMEDFYPDWLKSRHEFIEAYGKMREKIGLNVADICRRISSHRTEDEKEAVTRWLEGLECFHDLPKENLKQLSDRFITVEFQPEEALMKQGEKGDCMFVLYKGTVDVVIEDKGKVSEITCKAPVGEAAIKNNVNRSASVVAASHVTCLKLKKQDYADVLMALKKGEKARFNSFLQTIEFFRCWSPLKVQQLCSYLMLHNYQAGQTIYRLGDSSSTFYIIMEGQVILQSQVDVSQHHRWPVAEHEWELLSLVNKFKVTVRTLTQGQFFGESEVINDWPRLTSAVAEVKTQCLIINRKELFDVLNPSDLDKILSFNPLVISSKKVLEKQIIEKQKLRRKYQKALIDAADVDFSPSKRGVMTNYRSLKMKKWIYGLKERIQEERLKIRQDILESRKRTSRVLT